jgi:hypothetical protein
MKAKADAGGVDSDSPIDCMQSAVGIEVNAAQLSDDEDGYSPYAVDGCRLVYVSSELSAYAGALVLRNLADGGEEVLADAATMPRRPAMSGDVVAWEETIDGIPVVRVRTGTQTTTLSGDFDHAAEPRAATDAVVFTGWVSADAGSDTDVFVYSVASNSIALVAGGVGQQRFPDISATEIAVSDFSEDPTLTYDSQGIANADVLVIDRASGVTTTRAFYGKQAFPMLGAPGRLLYLEWVGIRPMPKLAGYTIRSVALDSLASDGLIIGQVGTDPPAIRPTARDTLVEWVEYAGTAATFWRAPADATSAKIAVSGPSDLALFAPQATTDFTVLATRSLSEVPKLETWAR